MSTHNIRRNAREQLLAYPLLVTGQIVVESETPRQDSAVALADGSSRMTGRRPFARLYHTLRFGYR